MNFYKYNSKDTFNPMDYSVQFDDDFLDIIERNFSFEEEIANVIYSIDRYDDVLLEKEDIVKLLNLVKEIKRRQIISDVADKRDKKYYLECIENLEKLLEEAIAENCKIFSMGD